MFACLPMQRNVNRRASAAASAGSILACQSGAFSIMEISQSIPHKLMCGRSLPYEAYTTRTHTFPGLLQLMDTTVVVGPRELPDADLCIHTYRSDLPIGQATTLESL